MCFIVPVGSLCLCFFFSIFCLLFVGVVCWALGMLVYLFFLLFFAPPVFRGAAPHPALPGVVCLLFYPRVCCVGGLVVLGGWWVNAGGVATRQWG